MYFNLKKVLYLTVDGLTDPLGQSQILPYLKGLSAYGYEVTIVSLEKELRLFESKQFIIEQCESSGIIWDYVTYKKSIPILSQYLNFRNLRALALEKCAIENYDIVHCRSYLSAMVGNDLREKFKLKFIFDMRGFWPDERVEGKTWNLLNPVHKLLYSFFKFQEKKLISSADGVVVLTNRAKDYISKNYKLKLTQSIFVIPCCVDLDLFNPESINRDRLSKLRRDLGISENKFILTYVGSVGTWYMLAEMITFFNQLKKKIDSHFLIVSQDNKDEIERRMLDSGLDFSNFSILSASRLDVPYAIAVGNLSLFFIRPTFSKIASSPTKLGEILAMGVPVVTNCGVGDVDDVLIEGKCGFLLKDFSEDGMKQIVDSIIDRPIPSSLHCRSIAAQRFSLESGVTLYKNVYEAIQK